MVNEGNSHLHPSDWKRYKDDGWDIKEDCDENQIYQFTEYLNDAVLKDKIRFQPVVKESRLEFLDVKVHLRNGYITPEIYSKETDSQAWALDKDRSGSAVPIRSNSIHFEDRSGSKLT